MMKKSYVKILGIFLGGVLLLPFGIEVLYKFFGNNIGYSKSDIMSYTVAVLGVFISMVALFRTKSVEEPLFKITHARIVDENNKEAVLIEIINEGIFDCEIMGVGYTDRKHKYHTCLVSPFTIKAKGSYQIIKSVDFIRDKVNKVIEHSIHGKVYYEIHTGIGHSEYVGITDLLTYIDEGKTMGKNKKGNNKKLLVKNQENKNIVKNSKEENQKENKKGWLEVSGIVATVATVLTKSLIYVHRKAYFDFWDIPREYISTEKGNTFYDFLILAAVALTVVALMNVLWFLVREAINKHNKHSWWARGIVLFVAFLLSLGYYIVMWKSKGVSWYDILMHIKNHFGDFFAQVFAVALIIALIVASSVYLFNGVVDLFSQIKKVRVLDIRGMLRISVAFIISFLILCWTVYNNSYSTCEETRALEVVTIDDKQFVVLGQSEGTWIVKECKFEGKQIVVCSDEYYFMDISSYPIKTHINSISNGACREESKKFYGDEKD